MNVPEVIGTAGFLVLTAPLVLMYVIQFWHKFALLPLIVGLTLDIIFTLMAQMYLACIPLLSGWACAVTLYVHHLSERKPEPVYDIPSWLHDSGAWQRQYEPLVKTPRGEIGSHRRP